MDLSELLKQYEQLNSYNLHVDGYEEWRPLAGKVFQVIDDNNLLIREDAKYLHQLGDLVHLRNYPYAVIDGEIVFTVARKGARYRYTSVLGASKTIASLDYGEASEADLLASSDRRKAFEERKRRELYDRLDQQTRADEEAAIKAQEAADAKLKELISLRERQREQKEKEVEEKVIAFLIRQAGNGVGYAQLDLGVRYLKGDGVEVDKKLAKHYLELAKGNGEDKADAYLKQLESQ